MRAQWIKILSLLFLISTSLAVPAATGVDGYKEFKWDMSTKNLLMYLKKSRFCNPRDFGKDAMGIHTIVCENFPFANEKRYGYFLLINDRLLRIVISIKQREIDILSDIFTKDYGRPSSGKVPYRGNLPTSSVGWANDTIMIKRVEVKDETKKSQKEPSELYLLMYSSSNYNRILESEQEKKYRSFAK